MKATLQPIYPQLALSLTCQWAGLLLLAMTALGGGIKLAMWGARLVIAALFDGAKERLAEPVVSFPMWSSVIQTVNGLIHLGIRWREKA
ncbi:hypothetical protein D2E53_15255 [Mycobacteroides abscessus]|nr:hypothetical protein [Mycobacteroides abscessus]MDM2171500.1 hypothetical protein [Mycobacteroides abscessus]MDM2178563.1 hypothetical protein [Mycobacteroides abscessus]MDM2207560.1 hypothetical protein [Mycobacteroides abscessus]MDM2211707.1 hypothetical protein [Mycobacteroides abscessus]MDM2217479.1 hypothetical protein [Mycobacteroides abscessus]